MTNYYQAIEGTKAHKLIEDLFNYQKEWTNNASKIESFLGFDMQKVLTLNVDTLTVERSTITKHRPEWLDQFKKNSYPAVAKSKSQINKEWKKLTSELGLRVITTFDTSHELDLLFLGKGGYSRVKDNYFYYSVGEIPQEALDNGFKLVPEYEYLRMKAEALEEKERESK